MIRLKRPPPFYPRSLLQGLAWSVGFLSLAMVGSTVVVFLLTAAVHRNAVERQREFAAAQAQSRAEVAAIRRGERLVQAELVEIDRLRKLVRQLGGNPGPQFTSTSAGQPAAVFLPPPSRPRPASSPSRSPRPRPSSSPSMSPRPTPAPSPVPTCDVIRHPLRCLPPPLRASGVGPAPNVLTEHGSDNLAVDVARVVVVVFGAVYTGWTVGRWRLDASCREGKVMHVALLALWAPIWLTEAEQLGHPFLYWRLPLAVAAVPATVWVEWTHRWVHHDGPSVSDRLRGITGRTLRGSADPQEPL